MRLKLITLMFVALSTLMMNGCSSWFGSDTPPKLVVTVKTSDDINPNIDNEATPVSVQIVQLSDNEGFFMGTFIELYNDLEKSLGKAYLSSKTEIGILPSSEKQIESILKKDTQYVGAIVGFAQYSNDNGKAIIPINNKQKDINIELYITGLKIELRNKDN